MDDNGDLMVIFQASYPTVIVVLFHWGFRTGRNGRSCNIASKKKQYNGRYPPVFNLGY